MFERLCQFWGCRRSATDWTRIEKWLGMWHCARHASKGPPARCRVITPPGAAMKVMEIDLTPEQQRGLRTDLDKWPAVR